MLNDVNGLKKRLSGQDNLRLVITDSGLGGLSVCAELERSLRLICPWNQVTIMYVNAWPEPVRGYNDMTDREERVRMFDSALRGVAGLEPDMIVIACNTLSILYEDTDFKRDSDIPVLGMINAGVELFYEALAADPDGSIILFGTTTTVESGIHKEKLTGLGIDERRVKTTACPGLASAIENDLEGTQVQDRMAGCIDEACEEDMGEGVLYAGFCCTHYGYIRDRFQRRLEECSGKTVRVLDPADRIVRYLVGSLLSVHMARECRVTVDVMSKMEIEEEKRKAVAGWIESISPLTAEALLSYSWKPELF